MSGTNLIIGNEGGRKGPLRLEGVGADAAAILHGGPDEQKSEIIQTFSGSLLDAIDGCLKNGVAIDPKLINSLASFKSAVELALLPSHPQASSSFTEYAPLQSFSRGLLKWLRKLKDEMTNGGVEHTYNTYLRAGAETAILYGNVLALTDMRDPEREPGPVDFSTRELIRTFALVRAFTAEDEYEKLWKMTEELKDGLVIFDSAIANAIEASEPDSKRHTRLKELKPFVLASIQALRLMHEFPPSSVQLSPTSVDSAGWRTVTTIVGEIDGRLGPALAA